MPNAKNKYVCIITKNQHEYNVSISRIDRNWSEAKYKIKSGSQTCTQQKDKEKSEIGQKC